MKILRESQEGIPNAGRSNKGARKVWQPAHLADQQVGTACISLAMQSLERGFQGIGMKPTWEKIRDALKINDFLGTDRSCSSSLVGKSTPLYSCQAGAWKLSATGACSVSPPVRVRLLLIGCDSESPHLVNLDFWRELSTRNHY
jgi:hypothetical protein